VQELGRARFFVTPVQLSPDDYDVLDDGQWVYRCPGCRAVHRYAKGEHLFPLLDEVA
jgi:hypothetical protein